MAVLITEMDDRTTQTRVVGKHPKESPHSDTNPLLVKIQGIQPLDAYADPYAIYAFQNKFGIGSDIVSDHLIRQKGWEQMSVYTHITQLDSFARVSQVYSLKEKNPRWKLSKYFSFKANKGFHDHCIFLLHIYLYLVHYYCSLID